MNKFFKFLNLKRDVDISIKMNEEEFIKQMNLFIDTENKSNLNPFITNKKKYRGTFDNNSFSIKKNVDPLDKIGIYTSFTSIKGKFNIEKEFVHINATTQIKPGLQIYFIIMATIIFGYMLTISNGLLFVILSILIIYPILIYSIYISKETLKEDFIKHFQN